MSTLLENAEAVRSRTDLARFIQRLSEDLRQAPEDWENKDLGSFLEALGGWIEDMDGYFINRGEPVPDSPEWKHIAQMLLAARIYE